jgi:hypothetical protein
MILNEKIFCIVKMNVPLTPVAAFVRTTLLVYRTQSELSLIDPLTHALIVAKGHKHVIRSHILQVLPDDHIAYHKRIIEFCDEHLARLPEYEVEDCKAVKENLEHMALDFFKLSLMDATSNKSVLLCR